MLIKITVSLLYLGALVFFAVRARKKTQNIDDYYVGGRNVPTILVVFSFYATFVSTNSFIGHSGKSYVYGVSWLLVGLVLVLLAALSWLVVAPRFRRTAGILGSVVPSDLFRLHFNSPPAGAVAAAIILFDSVFFLAAVLLGASESMGALLGIPFYYALAIVFSVQLAYTAVGGYLADVWSDAVQAVILLVGAVALPCALVAGLGGWDAAWSRMRAVDSGLLATGGSTFSLLRFTTSAPLLFIVGIGLSGGLKLVADPRQLSRFYGLRNPTSARNGVLGVAALVAVTYVFLLPVGLLARVYPLPAEAAARTDFIVPWLLGDAQVVGPVMGTVILTALLAAAMSTIDSVLLVAAGALQRDLLPLFGTRRRQNDVGTARFVVVSCAVLALVLAGLSRAYPATDLGIVELTVFAGALYAGAFLPGLIGILYWKRASAAGAMLGMVFGVASTAAWKFLVAPVHQNLAGIPEVFPGVVLGTAAFLAGCMFPRLRRRS